MSQKLATKPPTSRHSAPELMVAARELLAVEEDSLDIHIAVVPVSLLCQ